MRRAGLIVNPKAGRGSFASVQIDLIRILEGHGFSVVTRETTPQADSARLLAIETSKTCDLVIACGGDGTIHQVIQGLAGTPNILGVLPFGTANALARNLLLPLNPIFALEKLLTFKPRHIPLGFATSSVGNRWFIVLAGAGPDGALVREMKFATKINRGRNAYYTEAARLFATRRFPKFQVEYRLVGSRSWKSQLAVGLIASRVSNLGGLFAGLTASSSPHHPHLLIQLLAAPAHIAFPVWIAFGKLGLRRVNPLLTSLEVEEVRCTPLNQDEEVHTQVDGELFGPLPLTLGISPAKLNLLMPD